MSRRRLGPKAGAPSLAGLRWPARAADVGAGDHHRAGAAVVADRQVLPVGRQRLVVGPEDPPDVGGVLLASSRSRRSRRPRTAACMVTSSSGTSERLDQLAAGLVGEQRRPASAAPRPRRGAAQREQRVERRRPRSARSTAGSPPVAATAARSTTEVADPDADAGTSSPGWRTRRRAGCRRRTSDPAAPSTQVGRVIVAHQSQRRRGRAAGSATLHDPNEVNQRRAPAQPGLVGGRPSSWLASVSSSTAATSSTPAPSRLARVASSTLRKPWCVEARSSGSRCRTAWCSPAVHLNAQLAVQGRADAGGAARPGVGKASASGPPVRNFRRWSVRGDLVEGGEPVRGRRARRAAAAARRSTGTSSSSSPSADELVDRGDDPPGVVGQASPVAESRSAISRPRSASRSLRTVHAARAGSQGAGAAGDRRRRPPAAGRPDQVGVAGRGASRR